MLVVFWHRKAMKYLHLHILKVTRTNSLNRDVFDRQLPQRSFLKNSYYVNVISQTVQEGCVLGVVLELDVLEAHHPHFLILIIEQRGIRRSLPIPKQKHLIEIEVTWNHLIFYNYFLIQLGVWVKFRIDDHSRLFHFL